MKEEARRKRDSIYWLSLFILHPSSFILSWGDGLVDDLGAAEAEAAVQADGGLVLGGDLQDGPAQAAVVHAAQRFEQQRPAQAAPAQRRQDADVLDGAQRAALAQRLHRAERAVGADRQP